MQTSIELPPPTVPNKYHPLIGCPRCKEFKMTERLMVFEIRKEKEILKRDYVCDSCRYRLSGLK